MSSGSMVVEGSMVNPVLRSEIVRASRRDLAYGVRVAYGLMLLLTLAGAYTAWDFEGELRPTGHLGRFAEATFLRMGILQDLAILALVPALTAGAIAEEAAGNTLSSLLATRLTAFDSVAGKLGVRLACVGGLALGGLPA